MQLPPLQSRDGAGGQTLGNERSDLRLCFGLLIFHFGLVLAVRRRCHSNANDLFSKGHRQHLRHVVNEDELDAVLHVLGHFSQVVLVLRAG